MNWQVLGYRGEYVHQQPLLFQSEVLNSEEVSLSIWATPYGVEHDSEELVSGFMREIETQFRDFEATNPFPKLTCLDGPANILYGSTLYFNQNIYETYNRDHYNVGYDFFVLLKYKTKIYWVQKGWSQLLIFNNNGWQPLSYSPQVFFNKSHRPLHLELAGVEKSINFQVEHWGYYDDSPLLLAKSSIYPTGLTGQKEVDISEISKSYIQDNPESGLWLSLLSANE